MGRPGAGGAAPHACSAYAVAALGGGAPHDRNARQTLPFRAGKECADAAGVLWTMTSHLGNCRQNPWVGNPILSKWISLPPSTQPTAPMQRLQAFKFTLLPDGGQQRQMRRFAGACRFVYNQALALQKANFEAGGQFIGYVAEAQAPDRLAPWQRNTLAPGGSVPPLAARAQGPGAGLQELLCQARRFSAFQAQRAWRKLALPRPQAVRGRPGPQPYQAAETGLDTVSQQPGHPWHGKEHHPQRVRGQVGRQSRPNARCPSRCQLPPRPLASMSALRVSPP